MDKGQRELIYFADPMCSWCWGFSPVITRIVAEFGATLPLRVVMGGLRRGQKGAMSAALKSEIREHWQYVEALTGQPFDYGFFERQGFVYDTVPACRAIVAARLACPGEELGFLQFLHEGFYQRGIDVTRKSNLRMLALAHDFGGCDFSEQGFADICGSACCAKALAADFDAVLANGIRAFPALLGGSAASGYMALAHGYHSYEALRPSLERLVKGNTLPQGMMPGLVME